MAALVGAPFATLCDLVVVVPDGGGGGGGASGAFSLALSAYGLHNALGWLLSAASNMPLAVVCGALTVSAVVVAFDFEFFVFVSGMCILA